MNNSHFDCVVSGAFPVLLFICEGFEIRNGRVNFLVHSYSLSVQPWYLTAIRVQWNGQKAQFKIYERLLSLISHLPFFLSADLVWQRDPSLGQPPGLLQFLRAIPPELPAQRVADTSCLTVQRQPGAPWCGGAGGGRGCCCHSLSGIHVALLTFIFLQPYLFASSFSSPAPPVDASCTRKLKAAFEGQ